jgi:hypothetical protein
MNIPVLNRRDIEFNLSDLEVLIKDYIEEGGSIVRYNFIF